MEIDGARTLAEHLLREHGLSSWRLVFDRAKTRAGVCRFHQREIGLSGPLTQLHSADAVRDTILHEIAHALVGPTHQHDAVWRAKAAELGCSTKACLPPDAPRVAAPWVGTCPAGHRVGRHRRPERLASCRRCCRGFDPDYLFRWLHHGREVAMHSTYVAQLRSLDDPAGSTPDTTSGAVVVNGTRVRITAAGKYSGTVGVVEKRGRTRYHVRLPAGVVTVPFHLAEREALEAPTPVG